ncbi:hypothetical protein SAMN05216524_1011401 [Mucilaginibacter sp. OK098]|nr:hypothetical protein SAMN05216524_1011401 [Mucilaginibacter sp. OK098]
MLVNGKQESGKINALIFKCPVAILIYSAIADAATACYIVCSCQCLSACLPFLSLRGTKQSRTVHLRLAGSIHFCSPCIVCDCFVPRNDKFFIKYNYLPITTAALQPPKPEAVLRKLSALICIGETHTFTGLVTPNSLNPGVEIMRSSFRD